MTLEIKGKIQIRRGSLAAWQAKNPVISNGEPVYVTDEKVMKIGDGITAFNDLEAFPDSSDAAVTQQDLDDHINSEEPHPAYDDGRSLILLYENAKV